MKHLVILGAGTAGTLMAHKLDRRLPEGWKITVLDRDDDHLYQPGLLLVPFGMYQAEELRRPRTRLMPPGVELRLASIDRVDAPGRAVVLEGGERIPFDLLIIATGAELAPERTEGLTGPGWYETAFDFYTLEGASALQRALERFRGGRLVINIAEMPIKCPVAPLEFAFLADAWFTERGRRDDVEIVYATPLDGAFTRPRAASMLGELLEQRNIRLEPSFTLAKVHGAERWIEGYDGRRIAYDLLVTVPLHTGSGIIARSGFGDADAWVPTDRHTLQSKADPAIFALGDATDLPTSKAGSVAHFQGEVLTENILRAIEGRPLEPAFDGHANCFIETGHGKALLIDFNYETEPLPGRFPLPGVGPFTLLEESHVNHWGKLGFRWVYWNVLLRGQELPLDHRMVLAGKWS